MKIEGFKALKREDFSEEHQSLVDKIGYSLNIFAQQLTNAFNHNINVEDNLNQEIRQIEISVSSNGTPKNNNFLKLRTITTTKISGMQVIKAENLSNSTTYPNNAPFISFTQNNDLITINNITGLQADNMYRLTVKIIGN